MAKAKKRVSTPRKTASKKPTKETQKDWSAVLQRAEQIVQHLRGRTFVRDGFELDEIGAERMLLWCRARVAREPEPDPDPEFQAVADFLFAHGQSLDWLLSGSPLAGIYNSARLGAIERRALDRWRWR